MLPSIGLVIVGLAVLVIASDRVVVSAVRISSRLGVSPVLIGALIVGLGTSIPELLVSSLAAADGSLDVAVANVVASNAANMTLVLGAAALLTPLTIRRRILTRETQLMLISVGVLALIIGDSTISRAEAIGLLIALVVALGLLVVWSIGEPGAREAAEEVSAGVGAEFFFGALAIAVTVGGARLLLDGAVDIATRLDWPATFLGLLLGVGTSFPELATALAAARRRETDLIVGNILGSNIFNSLAVMGAAGLIGPGRLVDFDQLAGLGMVGGVALAAATMITGRRVARFEAVLLIAAFAGFVLLTL